MRRTKLTLLPTLLGAGALAALVGCGEPTVVGSADPEIGNSFGAAAPKGKADTIGLNRSNVSIKVGALNKEFLLQANLIDQSWGVPFFGGIQSRIVFFQLRGKELFMFEAPKDYSLEQGSGYADQKLLLARFPVVSTAGGNIVFDFNQGMTQLFVAYDWYASDFEAGSAPRRLESLPVASSFIQTAQLTQKNQLMITQVAQLGDAPALLPEAGNSSWKMVYYLSPYQPDPTFQPLQAPLDYDLAAYFEVAPKAGNTLVPVTRVAKFHQGRPIVFALSSNTPKEFRQAVKDGVLYWNKVFGAERLRVVDAPAGVSAPHPDYNLVQWVDSPVMGFAYADAQMDPRTGQVTHAQVFMSSMWAIYGKALAYQVWRSLEATEAKGKATRGKLFSLRGFEARDRHVQNHRKLLNLVRAAATSNASDAAILATAQNLVREVVAHEIGHCLGLRHNFAGSQSANVSMTDAESWLRTALRSGQPPAIAEGTVPSASVMDYNLEPAGIMIGQLIAEGRAALPYDVAAIGAAYAGRLLTVENTPVFCTDSHVDRPGQADCQPYDVGRTPGENAKLSMSGFARDLPQLILERYIGAKSPIPGEPAIPVEKVGFDAKSWAAMAMDAHFRAYRLFTDKGSTRAVQRTFALRSELNQDERKAAEAEAFARDIEAQGGLTAVFATLPDGWATQALARFDELLARHTTSVGWLDQKVTFSDGEKTVMRATAKTFLAQLEKGVFEQEMKLLANGPNPLFALWMGPEAAMFDGSGGKIVETPLSQALGAYIEQRVSQVILAPSGQVLKGELEVEVPAPPVPEAPPGIPPATETKTVTVELPLYAFPFEVRLAAANAFGGLSAEQVNWKKPHELALQDAFAAAMAELFGDGTPKDVWKLPSAFARWFDEKDQIDGALSGGGGGGGMPPFPFPF